eukprot:1159797-Pelagomonas_calceolata.AAC.11
MGQHGGQGGLGDGPAGYDAQAALKALQGMASPGTSTTAAGAAAASVQLQPPAAAGPVQSASIQRLQGVAMPNKNAQSGPLSPSATQYNSGEQGGGERLLRVECDGAWLKGSSVRVVGLMQKALPPLCNHPRPSVREALAADKGLALQATVGACCILQLLSVRTVVNIKSAKSAGGYRHKWPPSQASNANDR